MDKTASLEIIKERIKAKGKEIGFDLCGVSQPHKPKHYQIFTDWIEC